MAWLVVATALLSCSDDVGAVRAALVDGGSADAGDGEPYWWCDPSWNLIMGSSASETLTGTSGPDCIVGLGGDDTLVGLGGDDRLWGGSGNDTLHGGDGDDWLEGQTGSDVLYGEDDDDVLLGNEDDDELFGGDGTDILKGKAGCDRMVDLVGANEFYGEGGDDLIYASDDFWYIDAGDGDDVVHVVGTFPSWWGTGGAGNDRCDLDDCEASEPAACTTSGDCASGEHCDGVGVCVPDSFCGGGGCGSSDATCDGVDDDCDTNFDEDYVSTGTTCGMGACSATGSTSCVSGAVDDSCVPGTPATSDATCDAIDDDCDATNDEDYASTSTSCGVGACASSGTTSCVAGSVEDSCEPGTPASSDATCDGVDDDCDATNDEDFTSSATACGTGVCASNGSTSCASGVLHDSCTPGSPTGDDSVCNALDDDCDASVDEAYAPLATACGVGACASSGVTACVAGVVTDSCSPGSPSSDANCDGLDQDCDGVPDDEYVSTGTSCGVGACAASGALVCVAGSVSDTCAAGSPGPDDAVCDGVDEDCDGVLDEDFAPYCDDSAVVACVSGAESPSECDDADVCTGVETCASAACVPGAAPPIDDGNPCTSDACDPVTGVSHEDLPLGAACVDGDVCNGDETCDGAGACEAGTSLDPVDGDPCTDDLCDPVAGVSNPPSEAGTDCDDGDPCNGTETCDGTGLCAPGEPPLTGPCVPSAPVARIFVDEYRDVSNITVGGTVASYEGTAAPFVDSDGLNWNPQGITDGAADLVVSLGTSEVVVLSEVRLWDQGPGAEHVEIWTSDTGTASGDFVWSASLTIPPGGGARSYTFDPKPARHVRIRVLDNHAATAGAGMLTDVGFWTRPRDGGAISLHEAGVGVTASVGAFPERATDFATSTSWTTFGTGAPVAGQTLTIDLPGTGWHVIDRVRMWGGYEAFMNDFEIWVSATTDDPGAYTQVLSATLPRPPGSSRYYWFFFPSTVARYVQLRTVSSPFSDTVSVPALNVFTPHAGGLTVPFTDRSVAGGDPIVGWRWTFGDGSGSVDQHPVHTYAAPGSYVVTLQVIGEYGVNDTTTYLYEAHAPPVADFEATTAPFAQGDSLFLHDTSTSSVPLVQIGMTASGEPIAFSYDGLRYSLAPGVNTQYHLERRGTVRMLWEAIDANLLRGSRGLDIPVGNVAPSIDVADDQTLVWGQPWLPKSPIVITDATGAEWFNLACAYDFGDGTSLPGPNPCLVGDFYVPHAWDDPGDYEVIATATDLAGDAGEDRFMVHVTRRDSGLALSPVPGAESGGVQTVAAQLIDRYDGTASMAGKTVHFALGAQTSSATTDAEGRATSTLTFPGGTTPVNLVATFDGDTYYNAARGEAAYPETLRPSYPGNCGTDYWIALPNPCLDDGRCPSGDRDAEPFFRHYLFFTAEASTSVRVDMPGLGRTAHAVVDESGTARLELPIDVVSAVRQTAAVVSDTLHITSERIVCVHALEQLRQGTDGFLALPTNSLGREYVIGSVEGTVGGGLEPIMVSQFVVVGTQDGTDVTITPAYDLAAGPATPHTNVEPAGVPFVVQLDEGEVIQLRAFSAATPGPGDTYYDLTGSTVSATAPVAVLGGHQCAFVPLGIAACNTQVEQLPALETAGTEFLVTPFAVRDSGYIVRVVAATTPTEVRVDGTLEATLARGEFYVLDEASSVPHAVTTTEPALVVQFAKGLDAEPGPLPSTSGDPVMLVVVPAEQFDNGATVSAIPDHEYTRFDGTEVVTEVWAFDNYLNLTVPTADVGGVLVDDAVVSAPFNVISGTTWSYAQVAVTAGPHRVTHSSPSTRIGVTAYGWADYDGYAYPARMRLTELAGGCTPTATVAGDGIDNDCDGRYDEELGDGLDDDGDGLYDEDLFFESPPPVNLQPTAFDRSDVVLEDGNKTLVLAGADSNGDPITYEIVSLPSHGALTGAANTYDYIPSAGYVGPDAFTYRVCDASLCSDPATFAVTVQPVNDLPTIAMGALYSVFENELLELGLSATDPEGGPLSWSLVSGPDGVQVDSAASRFSWTPDERFSSQTWAVTVRVTDDAGAAAEHTFGVQVVERPDAPIIVSVPVRNTPYGLPYDYTVHAVDPDPLDVVEYLLVDGPPGMTIGLTSGVLGWTPTLADVGPHEIEVVARDTYGLLSAPQTYVLEVGGDVTLPTVTITAMPNPAVLGDPITLTVIASDDVSATIEGLNVEGTPVTLDAFGVGTYTPSAAGRHDAEASAVDPTGNRGTVTVELRVLDPSDATLPTVELTAPEPNDVLTYLHDATGTVLDDNLYRWWLDIRSAQGGAYRTLLTGTDEVNDALIGQIDATQLRNGIHFLRLRAEDVNGYVAEDVVPVRIDGHAKLGIVHLEFTDLVLPDFGIPIAVNRVYDSRDADQVGDFGYGWNLDVRQGSLTQNYPAGQGMAQYTVWGDPSPCTRAQDQLGHFAEVRLGDDEWYTFRPWLSGAGMLSGGCGGQVAYEQVDGTRPGAELIPLGNTEVRATAIPVVGPNGFAADSNFVDSTTGEIFDPQDFVLRLPDGRTFGLNAQRGIVSVEDQNGNTLHFVERGLWGSPAGMVHSSGRNVIFVQDAEDRIEQIIDSGGRSVGYEYDGDGNLDAFIDVLGRRTTFEYEEPSFPHYLTAIVDWRGVRVASFDYDDGGRMRELCDADGQCAQQTYDLAAQTMLRFTGLPNPTRYSYDGRGNVTQIVDGLGQFTQFYYGPPPWDVLIRREDPDGAETEFYYELNSNDVRARVDPHTASEDPADFTTTYTYRDWLTLDMSRYRRALASTTMPSGGTVFYDTDDAGNQIAVRDDAGNTVIARAFNADGSIASVTDRFGTHSYVYGADAQPIQVSEPDGTVTSMSYDPAGNLASLTQGGVTQRFLRDATGRPLFTDYGNGATVRYEYSAAESWTAIEGPTFGRVERTLSSAGRALSWTYPNGDTGSQTFDPAGQLRSATDALGNVTTYTYDDAGRLVSSDDSVRGTTSYVRDPMGRTLSVTDPSGETRSFTYDVRGAIATSTDERGHVTSSTSLPTGSTSTDPLGRASSSDLTTYGLPSSSTDAAGGSTGVTFLGRTGVDDASGFPLTQTDELGRVRAFGYTPQSVLQSATDLAGNVWTYAHTRVLGGSVRYDVQGGDVSLGVDGARAPVSRYGSRDPERDGHRPEALDAWVDRLQQVTSPLGETTTWSVGAGGEITQVSYPFGGTLTRTLGADLRIATETRPFGTTLTYTRDAAGRVTGRSGTDGSSESFMYAEQDRLSQITDATGTTDYAYDGAGRLSALDYPSGARFEQDWDVRDRLTQVRAVTPGTTPTTYESEYTYDEAGNLATVTDPFGRVTTYTYDAANQLTEVLRPNGVRTTTTYDARGLVASITHTDSGSTVLASVTYVRSASGEPTRITREDGSYVVVTYDAALRVAEEAYYDVSDTLVETIAYTYDVDGNRTSRTTSAGAETYTYASGSRLTEVSVGGSPIAEYTYDGGARVTRIQRGAQDLALTYDADDHTTAVEDAVSTVRREYDFDAEGRRTGRRRLVGAALATALSLVTAPTMAASLDSPHLNVDATGSATDGYVYDGEHALAAYDAVSTEALYYLRDAMGSVIGVVDHAGTGSARIHYDGFGNIRSTDGALADLPEEGAPRFQGMWLEGDGLYYVRARVYEAETGRFLSRDALDPDLEIPESRSCYALALSSPYTGRDPTGLATLSEFSFASAISNTLSLVASSASLAWRFRAAIGGAALGGGVAACALRCQLTISDLFLLRELNIGLHVLQMAKGGKSRLGDHHQEIRRRAEEELERRRREQEDEEDIDICDVLAVMYAAASGAEREAIKFVRKWAGCDGVPRRRG